MAITLTTKAPRCRKIVKYYWDCLIPGHRHPTELQASTCIKLVNKYKVSEPPWTFADYRNRLIILCWLNGLERRKLAAFHKATIKAIDGAICRERKKAEDCFQKQGIRYQNDLYEVKKTTIPQMEKDRFFWHHVFLTMWGQEML